jgi:hypothetical protein
MLPTKSVHFIPAGKAPLCGADAVKASYALAHRGNLFSLRGCDEVLPA